MAYLALARKYRPQVFEDVVGQEHVTRTLKNAIENGKISQAYLFSGPRGVGKTTTARILAKALNCEKGPATNPCNKCNTCNEVTGGSALDVVEIDGASNRGIDEMRALRENVKFMPSSGKYKIYIIDEVHQITGPGFNALLKTLEEPPEHVVFMMATTEPEKMPATILSRCQKFSLKLITQKKIFEHLKTITGKEKAKINDDALNLIASCGQGSIRDAMSILDQVISFGGKKEMKKEDIIYILGIIPEEELLKFSDCIAENKVKEAIKLIDDIVEKGYDVHQFVSDARGHFRNIMVVNTVGKDPELLVMSDKSMDLLEKKAKKFSSGNIIRIIDELGRIHDRMKWSEQSRTILEVGLFRLCQPHVSIDEIIEKISKLEGGGDLEEDEEEDSPAPPQPEKVEKVEKVEDDEVSEPAVKRNKVEPKDEGLDTAEEKPSEKKQAEKVKDDKPAEEAEAIVGYSDERWKKVLAEIKVTSPMLYESLVRGVPTSLNDGVLYIAFHTSNSFSKGTAERKKEEIEKFVKKGYGKKLKVRMEISEKAPAIGSSPVEDDEEIEEEYQPMTEELYKDIKDTDPVVDKVLNVFKGKIVKHKKKKDD